MGDTSKMWKRINSNTTNIENFKKFVDKQIVLANEHIERADEWYDSIRKINKNQIEMKKKINNNSSDVLTCLIAVTVLGFVVYHQSGKIHRLEKAVINLQRTEEDSEKE